ncbi:MAG: Na+/H+ antiporter NhaA [Alphaproteobacteria bacterium]|nr:Na+/H+ antiporter NhaA [Alphaproteobacteria bacterium]
MQHPSEIHAVRKGLLPRNIREFMETESASGVLMILFALLAVLAANSPVAALYKALVSTPLAFGVGDSIAVEPLKNWVKDILMVFFFLIIGLELKREMKEGFLSRRDQIMLPLFAAMGGMALPALIFFGLNHDSPETVNGWAIPSATDIAFALAILTLLGKRMPPAIKIFLLAVAIFDDLGAIIVIAAFYNTGLALLPLLLAAGGIFLLTLFNRANIAILTPYMLVGVFLWFCFYYSGIHTTLAGVIVGFAIPMRAGEDDRHSPLNACMHFLHPWVSFLVLPVFAFTSAGVSLAGLSIASLLEPLPLGIALGLLLGKQIGIFGTSWLLIKTKLVRMPEATQWRHLYAVSIVAGIGFTMSLFIGMLAFEAAPLQEMVKIGVIGGSLLCILWGGLVLRIVAR